MRITLTLVLLMFFHTAFAQVGGQEVFQFLGTSNSARLSALGGMLPAVLDEDPGLAWGNPAVTNPSMHNQILFAHRWDPAGIQSGYLSYGFAPDSSKYSFHAGLRYQDYGDFIHTDETGAELGNFDASEYAVVVGAGKRVHERISIGANIKWALSQLESYKSSGLALDLGANYIREEKDLVIGLVFKHAGFQVSKYHNTREKLPFDIQLGLSKRLEHLPFRYSITMHHLNRWNLLYDDPNEENNSLFSPEEPNDQWDWVDNLFRHFVFSGEFLLGKSESFRIRLGYNHMRRKELQLASVQSLAGFSFGTGFKISKFHIDYGYSSYHLAGAAHHFSLSTDLDRFYNN